MTAPREDANGVWVFIQQRDRWDVAHLLKIEAEVLREDAASRRKRSPARARLIEQAARLHDLSVGISP